jgi:uncharacterized protein YebE (UPF0316 family)
MLIWLTVASKTLSAENTNIWIMISYAGGFASGTYIGSWIEEKLAIGSSSVTVITKGLKYKLVEVLRSKGYGVSSVVCQGKDSENLMIFIQVNRKQIQYVRDIINDIAPDSFITISDTRQIVNGYFLSR